MSMYDVKKDTFIEVTDEMVHRVLDCINRTWNCIGHDILESTNGSVDREEMLDCVFDSSFMEDSDPEAAKYAMWLKTFKVHEWEERVLPKLFKVYGY